MAQGRKTALVVNLSVEDRRILEAWVRSRTIAAGLARRARIILMIAEGIVITRIAQLVGIRRRMIYVYVKRFNRKGLKGLNDKHGRGRKPVFLPEVAMILTKMACERPDVQGKSLSQWDCSELARKLIEDKVVKNSISAETVRRILENNKLKPWRHHMWLSPKHPRDSAFYDSVSNIIDLYTRPLDPWEAVLSIDEKTSLQPRPRTTPTKPAMRGNKPNLVEHEYKRDGALNLFAAFNTRTGKVFGQCYERKRQKEFIAFLEHIDRETPTEITLIHIVCDNLKVHSGKQVKQWLEEKKRFRFHFTPVHCSWMNQVEQWFSILQRKRFRIADFSSKQDLLVKIMDFISQWNNQAHPFNWSTKSVAKIMANAPTNMAA